ncbi:hypothetical protein E1264_01475 [Actinomadura sp. KC216]|uniref:hypothetical protein n=1 Tax=Actinomadura sp. KC216 TaxID=2530370 RepID=UPI001051B0D4|nr:hypothetical protein [Actinomadura sp. KC216]TDB91490.1 hypothetical protein E1264_01475 [Actinomadura sp. KC216]
MTPPWAVAELEPEQVTAELARWFPGVAVWQGEFTGSWWALAWDRAGRHRLVEASKPMELADRIAVLQRPLPRHAPRYSRDSLGDASSRVQPAPSRHRRSVRRGWLRSALSGLITVNASH